MKTSSGKAKGRRLQNKIRDLLLEHFSDKLEQDDIRSQIMGMSESYFHLVWNANRKKN